MVPVSVILIALALVFLASLRFERLSETAKSVIGFLTALVATLCGVVWGIEWTNASSERSEKLANIELLRAARDDAILAAGTVASYAGWDTVMSPGLSDHFVMVTPTPRAGTLDAVLRSEGVMRRMSPMAFRTVTSAMGTLAAAEALAKDAADAPSRRKVLRLAGSTYFVIQHALESELAFQEGRASPMERDGMIRHWYTVEINGDSVAGSWREFLAVPAVRESLLELGVAHFPRPGRPSY